MASNKLEKELLKKAKRWSRFLSFLPGVEAIFLSGSVAQGRVNENSDIDVFVVTKAGQIFTARFFVNLVLKICFQLAADEKNHAKKICPNHFITTKNLEIIEKEAYAAQLFAHNLFLAGDVSVWNVFVTKNRQWIKSFGYDFESVLPVEKVNLLKQSSPNFLYQTLEKGFKKFQIQKIERNRKNLPKEAKVILNDLEIRLHPHPKNIDFKTSV